MMDWASKGAEALEKSEALTAVSCYTKALIEHPNSPDYFVQRSTAFTRLKPPRHDLALKDAEYAVLLGQKRAKREKIQAAQQRRVISLHGLGQFADAKYLLKTMEKWRGQEDKKSKMEGDMWSVRIENKLKTVPEEQRKITVEEFPQIELPTEIQMKALLKSHLNPDGSPNLGGESQDALEELSGRQDSGISSAPCEEAERISYPPATTPVISKIRHEWYQNTNSIIVTLYAKGVAKDKAEVDFREDSLFVCFPHPSNPSSEFAFSLDPLYALIDPISSHYNVMSTKIEFTLKKAHPGQKWPNLESIGSLKRDDDSANVAKVAVASTLNEPKTIATGPAYPSSSRTGPKNWDKLATDLTSKKAESKKTDEMDGDSDSDFGGDAVDGFFKKLYSGADDDTRRAMMKSFQESNGTALSTNWAEVGKKRVEPVESKADD